MARNRIDLPDGKSIIYGHDAPCNGYFAQVYDPANDYEPIEDIGFFKGVNKNVILTLFAKYNATELAKKQTPKAFNNLILDLPC